jgi:hypothetical protein
MLVVFMKSEAIEVVTCRASPLKEEFKMCNWRARKLSVNGLSRLRCATDGVNPDNSRSTFFSFEINNTY